MSGHRIKGLCGLTLTAILLAGTPAPMLSGTVASFTATNANVTGAPDSIRIEILRWSTEEERERLMSAWSLKRGAVNTPGPTGGAGRGRASPIATGTRPPDAMSLSPEGALAGALKETSTVGYLWVGSEVAGYALRYASKTPCPEGLDRIILITHRRLGAMNDLWKPAGESALAKYDFSVIELRVNAKGEGEGKASLTGKVAPDSALKMIALENYEASPVVLSSVKTRTGSQ